jgi:hypothetical protein
VAHVTQDEAELEGRVAGRRRGDLCLETLAGGLQPAARRVGAGQHDAARRRRPRRRRQGFHLSEPSLDQGPLGGVDR